MSGGSKIIEENNKKVLFLETPAPPLEVPWAMALPLEVPEDKF